MMHKEADLNPYSGRWVALIRDQVVGHGGTPEQALISAKKNRHKEIPNVKFVPTSNPLIFSPLLERVRKYMPTGFQVYLVGGAVRDALIQRPCHDFDLIIPGDVIRIARKLANQLDGAFYLLDERRETARVIFKNGSDKRIVVDLAKQRGESLEDDLRDRDFTVNAIAVDLKNPQEVYDPLGGARDLLNKVLRSCSQDAFHNDPVRILRAIRIAVEFGLRINPETRQSMRQALHMIDMVSSERIRDELFRILGGTSPAISIRALDRIGALPFILPELPKLKGKNQSLPHIHDAWGHTIETIKSLDNLIKNINPPQEAERSSNLFIGMFQLGMGGLRRDISEHLLSEVIVNRSVKSLLFMGALFHDIGKTCAKPFDDNGRIRFLEHELVGSNIIGHRANALNLSNQEINRLKTIVLHHMQPALFARKGETPDPLSIYRYYRDTGPAGIDIGLLSLADLMATYGSTLTQERWEKQINVVRSLLIAWWKEPEKLINPPKLLTGNQIMGVFNLEPGPHIGRLLESLREAQVTGEIFSEKDAHKYIAERVKKLYREID